MRDGAYVMLLPRPNKPTSSLQKNNALSQNIRLDIKKLGTSALGAAPIIASQSEQEMGDMSETRGRQAQKNPELPGFFIRTAEPSYLESITSIKA